MDDFQGSEYLNNNKKQHAIVGYKLFLDINGKYFSLVESNPMEFEEGKDYQEQGDMAIGKHSFCFGTKDDFDILAYAGYDASIAVGVLTVYPPYKLYHDDYRDCVNLGYSQHITVNKIMNFEEVCEFLSKKSHSAAKLINLHLINRDLLIKLIDKYAGDSFFVDQIRYAPPIYKDPEMNEYLTKKAAEYKEARRKNN